MFFVWVENITAAMSNTSGGQQRGIESLLRALHHQQQPEQSQSSDSAPVITGGVLSQIEEQAEESTANGEFNEHTDRPDAPVIFSLDPSSISRTPCTSASNLQPLATSSDEKDHRNLETNLERFNKNVITLMSQATSPISLTPSASTGKPFAFYQRIHRHNSAHSLNIPNIVVTNSGGNGDKSTEVDQHLHHHKRFSFGLRRHSHAVVGNIIRVVIFMSAF